MIDSDLIIQQIRQIVGGQHAISFLDERASSQRHCLGDIPVGDESPMAIVMPDSVKQVQAVLQMAATLGFAVTIIPNASGNGAGTRIRAKQSIVLDLSRMNKILEVDVDSGYALVEPGVSFDQLREYLAESDARHWVDTDLNGANSVSGSIAERAFGYTPYGDHLLMQCGMEVVTANGEVLRTGMGALPGSDTWQLFKYNYGPYLDGLFSRSDLAVVTKMGLWLMPAPPAYHPFMVSLPDAESLNQAIEVLRPLKIEMVVPNTVSICHVSADTALLKEAGILEATAGGNMGSDEWNLFGALYGVPENVKVIWTSVAGALGAIANATVFSADSPPENHPTWPLRERLMRGEPAFSRAEPSATNTLWFAAAAPMEGAAALEMHRLADAALSAAGISYAHEFSLTWRTMFMRVSIPYSAQQFPGYSDAVLELIEQLTEAGYAISHDSRELTEAVSEAHTAGGLKVLYGALGEALDPDRTLRN